MFEAWVRHTPAAMLALAVVGAGSAAGSGVNRTQDASLGGWTSECSGVDPLSYADSGAYISTPVDQPVAGTKPISSYRFKYYVPAYSFGSLRWVFWDPILHAPVSSTAGLRASGTAYSTMAGVSGGDGEFNPPLVLQSIPAVAETLSSTVAFEFMGGSFNHQPDATASTQIAYSFTDPQGARTPLEGSHAAMTHEICPVAPSMEQLKVVQSVLRTSSLVDTTSYDILQAFRVPDAVSVEWAEFAIKRARSAADFGFEHGFPMGYFSVSIVDPAAPGGPPVTLPSPMWTAEFSFGSLDMWAQTSWPATPARLEPGHTYWLRFQSHGALAPSARQMTGSDGSNYYASIGNLYARRGSTAAWTPVASRHLAFRLIGTVSSTTGVTPAPGVQPGLNLSVSPIPTRSTALVQWSGGSGRVRLEVFDASGRRVGLVPDAGDGDRGVWAWTPGLAGSGGARAGVYWVRAADSAGRSATTKVVVAR